MKVTIHQAICGEKNKGWDLLASSLDNASLAKNIAFKADMQDSPPSGIPWQPIVRGFAYDEYFLFIKTFPDNSPDVRKGRVFSHCIIVPKTTLGKLENISPIIALFLNEINKEFNPVAVEIDLTNVTNYELPHELTGRFNKVVKGYNNFDKYNNTILWFGQENYLDAVLRFWQILSQSEREQFYFGINFNVNEIPKSSLNLICIPSNLETKFVNSGYCLIGKNDSEILTEFSEQFIAGDVEAKRKLNQFLEAVEARLIQKDEISMVAGGLKTYENLQQTTDIKLLNTLSNIVILISPDNKKGKKVKENIINRVSEVVPTLDEKDLLLLKSFKVENFDSGLTKLKKAVTSWGNTNLFSEKANKSKDFSALIVSIFENDTKEKNWLLLFLRNEVISFLSKLTEASVSVLFIWFKKNSSLVDSLQKYTDKSSSGESLLIANLPKKGDPLLDHICKYAAKNKLILLLAETVKRLYDLDKAVQELFLVDTDTTNTKGIEILLDGVSPKEVIKCTLSNPDPRLINISGAHCYRDTYLLDILETDNPTWLDIWSIALKKGNEFEDGIIKPLEKAFQVFDLLLKGKQVNQIILQKFSTSNQSSILKYSQRAKLWNKLPEDVKFPILVNTFSEIVNSKATHLWATSYNDVRNEIFKSNALLYLYKNANINNVLWLFGNRTELRESNLIDFLKTRANSLGSNDCKELGLIINQHKFESAFNLINDSLVKINPAFNHTIELSANTFRKNNFAFDLFGMLGTYTPKKKFNHITQIKVLFASANPNDSDRIRVDKELRELDKTLQSLKNRDRIDLISKGAIEFKEFAKTILEFEPNIVHFSGHGDKYGIAMEKNSGDLQAIPNKNLSDFFKLFDGKITCVVLNSCYSESQAQVISKHNMYVVGMNDKINDSLAINFSSAFYTSLSTGKDPLFSFKFALSAVNLENEAAANIPVLWYQGVKIGGVESKDLISSGTKKTKKK